MIISKMELEVVLIVECLGCNGCDYVTLNASDFPRFAHKLKACCPTPKPRIAIHDFVMTTSMRP